MLEFPKTKEQSHFEDMAQLAVKLLSELSEAERSEIFNYIIYKHNERYEK